MQSPLLYALAGFLLGNGFPHFIFGVSGKLFRSPFGRKTKPRVNVVWGLVNFIASSGLALFLSQTALTTSHAIYFLVGFWLAVAMFGLFIKQFYVE